MPLEAYLTRNLVYKIGHRRQHIFFFLKKNWPFPASFLYFRLFNKQLTVNKMFNVNKILPMTEFKPRTSAIGSDRSTNWATQPLEHILVRRFPCAHHGSHPHFCFIIRLHRTGQTTQTWRTGQALAVQLPTTENPSKMEFISVKMEATGINWFLYSQPCEWPVRPDVEIKVANIFRKFPKK